MAPNQIRWFVAAAAVVALIFFGNEAYLKYVGSGGRVVFTDYAIFRFASLLLWRGDLVTLFDTGKFLAARDAFEQTALGFSPFPYPPSALWVIAPLNPLPELLRLALWLGIPFTGFAWVIGRETARPWRTAALLLLSPASLTNIASGQNGFLAAALFCGGLLALEARPLLAGLLLGLLSFKLQLGILLPFVLLAGRHYRAFFAAAIVTIALLLGSLLLFGTEPWRLYLEVAVPTQRGYLETGSGFALLTSPSVFSAARLIGLPVAVAYGLQAVAAVLVLAACIRVFRRPATSLAAKAPLVMVGAFLVTPYASSYDLCIVAVAQILVLTRDPQASANKYRLHAVVWMLPLLMISLGVIHLPVGPIALSALFVVLLRDALAEQPGSRAAAGTACRAASPLATGDARVESKPGVGR